MPRTRYYSRYLTITYASYYYKWFCICYFVFEQWFHLELNQVRLTQRFTYQQFLDIVSHLSCENPENFDLEQFKYELKKLKNSNDGFLRIEKSKRDQQKYASFLKSLLSLPNIEKNVENTSLNTCLPLKKSF